MSDAKTVEEHITAEYTRCASGAKNIFDSCVKGIGKPVLPQPWYWAWWPTYEPTCSQSYASTMHSCMETMLMRQERLLKAKMTFTQISPDGSSSIHVRVRPRVP
jgi:hypothetical protein